MNRIYQQLFCDNAVLISNLKQLEANVEYTLCNLHENPKLIVDAYVPKEDCTVLRFECNAGMIRCWADYELDDLIEFNFSNNVLFAKLTIDIAYDLNGHLLDASTSYWDELAQTGRQ